MRFCLITLALIGCISCNLKDSNQIFIQMCDPQIGMGGYDDDMIRFNLAVDKINRMQPDFVIVCGDLVHHAHDSAYDDFEEVINKLEVPYLLAPGNHDLGNIPSDSSLHAYRSRFGHDYFVRHYGEVSMVVINTQLIKENVKLASDLQMKWIASMLDSLAHTKQKVFVMGHYPLFIKEVNEEENYFNLPDDRRTTLLELFKSSGVLAYLSGHKHELLKNEYAGIFLVSGETTSKNFDERPFGFRKWSVQKCRITHEFVPL